MRSSETLFALVTGASRGIGRAIAIDLAKRGVRIAVHYRRDCDAAERTLGELDGSGHAAFAADFTEPSAAWRLWHEVRAAFGGIDILINNAGLYHAHPPLQTAYEAWQTAWQQALAANLIGPADLCWLAARDMAVRAVGVDDPFGAGRIVNISSRGAFRGEPDCPGYGAAKAGLNALSQSLAKALAPKHIYLYCLAPGWVETDMAAAHLSGPQGAEILAQYPLGRVSRPAEIAQAAVYCALDAPASMTGCIIDINGASYLRM